jgi:molybdate transport system substrate-binding protein
VFGLPSGSVRPLRSVLFFVGIALFAFACSRQTASPSTTSGQVRIAAAASLKPILPDLIAAFSKTNPDVSITATYGASGNFYSQLVNAAPYDLFLSADLSYPQKLSDAGLTAAGPREYAAGRLVIWTLKSSGLDISSLKVVSDLRVKKLAIASPAHAPYGRAAQRALEAAKIIDVVRDKLVLGESVEQAATFVRTGAAEVGILSKSQAVSSPMKDEGVFTDIPDALYDPISHGGVIMKSSPNAAAAEAFLAFVTGPEGQAILGRSGLAAIKD